jgi:hypothetical protein
MAMSLSPDDYIDPARDQLNQLYEDQQQQQQVFDINKYKTKKCLLLTYKRTPQNNCNKILVNYFKQVFTNSTHCEFDYNQEKRKYYTVSKPTSVDQLINNTNWTIVFLYGFLQDPFDKQCVVIKEALTQLNIPTERRSIVTGQLNINNFFAQLIKYQHRNDDLHLLLEDYFKLREDNYKLRVELGIKDPNGFHSPDYSKIQDVFNETLARAVDNDLPSNVIQSIYFIRDNLDLVPLQRQQAIQTEFETLLDKSAFTIEPSDDNEYPLIKLTRPQDWNRCIQSVFNQFAAETDLSNKAIEDISIDDFQVLNRALERVTNPVDQARIQEMIDRYQDFDPNERQQFIDQLRSQL